MKSYWFSGCVLLLMIFIAPGVAQADSCSCTAPDGSCSASITCKGGCAAVCMTGGSCSAKCIGGSSTNPEPLEPMPLQAPVDEGESFQANLPDSVGEQLVQLQIQDASGREISEALQTLTGLAIEFRTEDPAETLTIDASNVPVRGLLELLATRGAVAVRGTRATWQPPLEDALRETNVTLSVDEVDAADIVAMLADILGTPLHFEPTVDDATISIDVKNAPVGDVLTILHRFGEITGPGLGEAP